MDAETERRFYSGNSQLKRTFSDAFNWEDYVRRTRPDTERRERYLHPLLDRRTRLIELGCGYGFLLSRIKDRVGMAVGIEPGEDRRAFGSETLGLDIRPPSLSAAGIGRDSTDIACAFQVLEHIRQPAPFLAEVFDALRPGGRLVVEVPNFADLYVTLSRPYRAFHFQSAHAVYYTPVTLRHVLERAGFDVQRIEGIQRYAIGNALHWLRHGAPQLQKPSRHLANRGLAITDRAYRRLLQRLLRSDTVICLARKPSSPGGNEASGPAASEVPDMAPMSAAPQDRHIAWNNDPRESCRNDGRP